MLALVAAIAIAVNDRPLDVVAVQERNRILVPMRQLFEALGAQVGYDGSSRRITASSGERRVTFAIGERGTRVIGGRTYVPLRFITAALGASVDYDAQTQLVTVRTQSRSAQTQALASPEPVASLGPPAGSSEATAFPTITANISAAPGDRIATMHMLLDGADVTQLVSYGGTSITYIPRRALPIGTHTVRVSGTMTSGNTFSREWSFETTRAAMESIGPSNEGYGDYGGLQLSVGGSIFGPNQYMPVQLIAPPGGQAFAFICNSPWQYPMYASPSSSFYSVTLQAPWGAPLSQCPITAMYVSPSGQIFYAPYPVYVTFSPTIPYPVPPYQTPTPVPIAPTPTPPPRHIRPGPVVTRAPLTPAPLTPAPLTPAPVAPVAATPHPYPRPTGRPPVRMTPRPLPVRTPPG